MAIRNIREYGDEVLKKTCKEVKEMTPRTKELIEDMLETMYDANGVGLAAPQVGILKRIVVIDTTGEDPYILINPRIVESSGDRTGRVLKCSREVWYCDQTQLCESGSFGCQYETHRSRGYGIIGKSHLPRTGSPGWTSLCGEGGRSSAGHDL